METGKHFFKGEAAYASRNNNYTGQHREHLYDTTDPRGIGLIPLGDRQRDVVEFGVNYIEERNGADVSSSRKR